MADEPKGRWVWVAEKGPELMHLPEHTKIVSFTKEAAAERAEKCKADQAAATAEFLVRLNRGGVVP